MSAPLSITNAPGLSQIRYRCGTFTTFRQAMLDRVADPDLLASAVTTLAVPVTPTDTQISVTDAVNFPISEPFRIKIATEYLTVVSGAGTLVWKVLRGPSPILHGQGNAVVLDPENPFTRWHPGIDSDYQTMFVELWAYLGDVLTFYQERIANEAFLGTATQRDSLLRLAGLTGYRPSPGTGASTLVSFTAAKGQTVNIPAGFRVGSRALPGQPAVTYETSAALTATADNSLLTMAAKSPRVPYDPGSIVIHGVNTKLKQNEYLLAIEDQGDNAEQTHLLRIDRVSPDASANVTTIAWHDVAGQYTQATKDIRLYSFSVVAAPLGHVAPRWEFISPTFTNFDRQHPGVLFENARWDLPFVTDVLTRFEIANVWFYLPAPGEAANVLHLDSTYDGLKYTARNPGWAVLVTDGGIFQVMHVIDARPTGKTAYALSARSTRLTFNFNEFISPYTFPFRNTQVLTGVEPLTLETDLPLPAELSGSILTLAGLHTQLQPGQTVVVQGNFLAESATIAASVVTDPVDNVTFVQLKAPLTNTYVRATATLLANIVEVTAGETVRDEVLGSSNAAAFQTFSLAQKPLTYLPSTSAEGQAAVQSSLIVNVNGIAWTERPSLAESGPEAQEYTTALDDAGQTTVLFGDGFNGARPPSGTANVHARYRKGLGRAGNQPGGALQQLVDSTPNLQKVTNPLPSTGGSDPESASQIRRNAPSSLRTFSRAVNAGDYAALALSYPGIGKSSAAWIGLGVPHPYIQLTAATIDGSPLQGSVLAGKLRRFLDSHRDPNVPLRLQDFQPVYLQVVVNLEIDDRFPHQATLDCVTAALSPSVNADGTPGFFAFERQQFGRAIYLSDLYAATQSVPGVRDSNVVTLLRLGPALPDPPSTAPHDVLTGPTEIATIDPVAFPGSTLTVTALGGFADR